jgi:hypothetical protein
LLKAEGMPWNDEFTYSFTKIRSKRSERGPMLAERKSGAGPV